MLGILTRRVAERVILRRGPERVILRRGAERVILRREPERVILRREAPKGSLSIQGFYGRGARAILSLASLAQDDARGRLARAG